MSTVTVLLHGNDRLAGAIEQRLTKAGCRVVKLDLAGAAYWTRRSGASNTGQRPSYVAINAALFSRWQFGEDSHPERSEAVRASAISSAIASEKSENESR